VWNIDWPSLAPLEADACFDGDDEVVDLVSEKLDLLIIQELQLNSAASLADIARKLRLNSRKIRYHYIAHIVEKRLIGNYIVRWQAGRSDERLSNLGIAIELRDFPQSSLPEIVKRMRSIPFIWFDALSSSRRLYLAYLSLPLTHYVETLDYLRSLSKYDVKLRVINAACSQGYAVPHEMYDEVHGWGFDCGKALDAIKVELPIRLHK
jgi:hypothetical protein